MTDSALRELADDPSSRKRFFKMLGGAGAVSAFSVALAACGGDDDESSSSSAKPAPPAKSADTNKSDLEILNYALTLEHLEASFYRDGLEGFVAADFDKGVFANLGLIRDHEVAHVATLIGVIEDLDGDPVEEADYDFGDAFDDPGAFLAVAQALENTGVAAYTGAAQFLIDNDDLVTAALTIHGVEARHAAYLNRLNGISPFPDAVDAPLTPDEVLAIAMPFIVGDTTDGTSSSAGTGSANGTGGTTMPTTGIGSIGRSSHESGLREELALLGLASAAVGTALLHARRDRATRDTQV